MSVALGYTQYITSALQAMKGCGLLMPLLDKANASDNAVRQLAYVIPTFPRRVSIASPLAMRASHEHLPARRTWGGDRQNCVSALFHLLHLAPPPSRFFVVADEKRSAEVQPCRTKNLTEKT